MRPVKEKKERALGVKLFLKADRCAGPKCVMIRRPHRPGAHGQKRHTVSEFGKQLQEKQKIQLVYGFSNRQLRNLFRDNSKEKIGFIFETRLDRVCFLLGLVRSPRIARQMVSHGHVLVNGRKVTIPSYHVKIGDIVAIRPESKKSKFFDDIQTYLKQYAPPKWLKLDAENLKGECVGKPEPGERQSFFDMNLVGEFYSR